MKKQTITALLAIALPAFSFLNAASATPYCHACPFSCDYLELGHKDCSQVNSTPGSCCVDLTQKGLDRARDYDHAPAASPAWQRQRQETCPAGFSQSEQKCSTEERRRGCKDIRLNSGLGCVKR